MPANLFNVARPRHSPLKNGKYLGTNRLYGILVIKRIFERLIKVTGI